MSEAIEPINLLSREQLIAALRDKGIVISTNLTIEKLRELLAHQQPATPAKPSE